MLVLNYIKDIIYKRRELERAVENKVHKICLHVNQQKFWVVSNSNYKSMEKIESGKFLEVYELATLCDNQISTLYFDVENNEWITETGDQFYHTIWADRCRKSIYFFETMTCYVNIHFLKELLGNDIVIHIKNVFAKYLDLAVFQNFRVKKYQQ